MHAVVVEQTFFFFFISNEKVYQRKTIPVNSGVLREK